MKTLYWKMQLGFPYLKVCILGIILSLLGSVCIIISVVGIVKLAWGYYVGTGIWGGVVITLAGLSAIYAARVRSSLSAKLYLLGSLLAALVSFIILVLSAGGLTYKSGFYNFIKFHSATHQMTMLLHGSVLSVGVLSLACNVLSVIVNLKFVRFDKDKTDGLKLRRFRYRLSDPDAVYRTNSLRGGSGTLRSSTSSRTPLHSSDHSNRRSRHASDGECNDSSRPSRDSTLHRRDSDGSRGSSRSRHSHRNSHHRQSSALHQSGRNIQSAEFSNSDPTLTGISRDNQCTLLQTSHGHDDGRESFFPLNIVELPNVSLGENTEIFPMFHPDEEPLPPYEESRLENTRMPADSRGDSDSIVTAIFNDADTNCGSIIPVRYLPMNIPVNEVHNEQMRERRNVRDSRSEQRRNSRDSRRLKRQKVSPENNGSEEHDNRINVMRIASYRHNNPSLLPSQMLRADGLHLSHINESSQGDHLPPQYYHITNTSGFQSSNGGSGVEFASESIPQVSVQPSGSSTSLEVCTLTGERPTHNVSSHFGEDSAVEQDSIRASFDSETSALFHLNRSYGSSDTSLQERVIAQLNNIESYSISRSPTAHAHGTVSVSMNSGGHPISSPSSQSLAGEFSQFVNSSTSSHCALPGGALPVAFGSPNSAFRPVTQKCTPPSHMPISPDTLLPAVSLNRDSDFSLSWKDIPLPPSHNNSNRMASAPTKELGAKNIPLPAPGSGQRVLTQGPESSQMELNGTFLGRMHDRNTEAAGGRDKGNNIESAFVTLPQRHLIDDVSNERLSLQQNTSRNSLAQRHVQPEGRNVRLRPQPSAMVSSRLEPSASDSSRLRRDDIQLSISPRPRERHSSPSSGAIIPDALSPRGNNGCLSVSRVQTHPLSQGQCFAEDHIPGQRQHIVQQLRPFHLNQRQEQPQQLQPPGQQPTHPPQNPPNPSHHPDRPLFSVLL